MACDKKYVSKKKISNPKLLIYCTVSKSLIKNKAYTCHKDLDKIRCLVRST